ncbi:hypothetical protein EGW08_012213, partial [Elysia chlorotica]
MGHSFQYFLGYLYLHWIFFFIGFCACNSQQRTHAKSSASALLKDIDGSLTQDGAHLGKSVYAGARQEIDTAHSPITPSDMKGARDGQHRTHGQAHSENQVSPPLVTARLDTRSLLIGPEGPKPSLANRQWHPWDWLRPRSADRNFGREDAPTTRKPGSPLFTSAQTEKSAKIGGSNGIKMAGASSRHVPFFSEPRISGLNQYRRRKFHFRWDHSTKAPIFKMPKLSELHNRQPIQHELLNAEGIKGTRSIIYKSEVSNKTDPPNPVSSMSTMPPKAPPLHAMNFSASSKQTKESFVDIPNTGYKKESRKEKDATYTFSYKDQILKGDSEHHDISQSIHRDSSSQHLNGNRGLAKATPPAQQDSSGQNNEPSLNTKDNDGNHRTRRAATLYVDPRVSQSSRARKEGDAIIGALFPLHHQPSLKTAYSRQCSTIREQYGIQRVEVFLMTIERINRDPDLLPNITLGWDIRDTCWYSPIALENSIDFIKDAIASQQTYASAATTSPPNVASTASSSLTSSTSSASSLLSSSLSSSSVQNLLQIFNIPQIGYSATSYDLSDKSHYKYFLRVVPPDLYQAQALADIVSSFNWTYISLVHTDGNYGIRGMEAFKDRATEKGICFGAEDNIASSAEDKEFDTVVDKLLMTPNATVVVCFCEGLTVRKLMEATRRKNVEGAFLLIGSDGWGNRVDVVSGVESAIAGSISLMLYSPKISEFATHYSSLGPDGSPNNPWFKEFWQERFKCYLEEENKPYQT